MRLLVVGGSGFLGGYVLREAVRQGHQILALARSPAAARSVEGNGARDAGLLGGCDDARAVTVTERREADQGLTADRRERLVETAGVIEVAGEGACAVALNRAGSRGAAGQGQDLVPLADGLAEHVAAEKATAADDH